MEEKENFLLTEENSEKYFHTFNDANKIPNTNKSET